MGFVLRCVHYLLDIINLLQRSHLMLTWFVFGFRPFFRNSWLDFRVLSCIQLLLEVDLVESGEVGWAGLRRDHRGLRRREWTIGGRLRRHVFGPSAASSCEIRILTGPPHLRKPQQAWLRWWRLDIPWAFVMRESEKDTIPGIRPSQSSRALRYDESSVQPLNRTQVSAAPASSTCPAEPVLQHSQLEYVSQHR